MKKTLMYVVIIYGLIIATLSLTSCLPEKSDKTKVANDIPLRQLVNVNNISEKLSGNYFLIGGSIKGSSTEIQKIKMYGLVDDSYKYIELDLESVRIKIDTSITKPFLRIEYYSQEGKYKDNYISENDSWIPRKFTIHTPEKYLPENLLPIQVY